MHLQEIILDDVLLQRRVVLSQVIYRLEINLHHFHQTRFLHQELRHYAHPRSHLQHRNLRAGIHRISNLLSNAQIGQEMLSKKLLWFNCYHIWSFALQRYE